MHCTWIKMGIREDWFFRMDLLGPKYGLNLCVCIWKANKLQMNAHFLYKCTGIYLPMHYLKTNLYAISIGFNTWQGRC